MLSDDVCCLRALVRMLTGPCTVALATVFAATGVYGVGQLARMRWRGIRTVNDLNQAAMSTAMAAMILRPSFTAGWWAQVALFAGFAVVFIRQLAGTVGVAARAGVLSQVTMNAAMVWMLVSMPNLMVAEMPHHGPAAAGSQAWTILLTWDVVGVLSLVTSWWLVQAVRCRGDRLLCWCHALSSSGMAAMLVTVLPGL